MILLREIKIMVTFELTNYKNKDFPFTELCAFDTHDFAILYINDLIRNSNINNTSKFRVTFTFGGKYYDLMVG